MSPVEFIFDQLCTLQLQMLCLEQLQCVKRKSGGGNYKEEDYRSGIDINTVFTHDEGSI